LNEQGRWEILQTIRSYGPAAAGAVADVLAVAETLVIGDDRVLSCALEILADVTPALAPYFARLVALSERVRIRKSPHWMFADIFARLVLHHPEALERLRQLLRESISRKGDDWDRQAVRQAAARGLGSLGPGAVPALPELAALLDDLSDNVRRAAADALVAIRDPAVLPLLQRAARDKDPLVRVAAVKGLGASGDVSEATVTAVLSVLADENPYIRRQAITALVALKPDTEAVRHALRIAGKDSDATVRTRSAALLKRIEGRKGKRK
jgi:HEAT repeat protein